MAPGALRPSKASAHMRPIAALAILPRAKGRYMPDENLRVPDKMRSLFRLGRQGQQGDLRRPQAAAVIPQVKAVAGD